MSLVIDTSDLIGKPFVWGGRGPDGYDCFGICKEVARRAGIEYPEVPVSMRNEGCVSDVFSDVIDEFNEGRSQWRKLEVIGLPQPLTTILMQVHGKWHMGLTISKYGEFIHCVARHKVNITTISNPMWSGTIKGYYVYK